MDEQQKELCPSSKRDSKQHAWHFDGDDPYVICSYCGEVRDAISGAVIKPVTPPSHPQGDEDQEVTPKQLVQILKDYFAWSARYIEAARMGDERLMRLLDDEFDVEKIVYKVTRSKSKS